MPGVIGTCLLDTFPAGVRACGSTKPPDFVIIRPFPGSAPDNLPCTDDTYVVVSHVGEEFVNRAQLKAMLLRAIADADPDEVPPEFDASRTPDLGAEADKLIDTACELQLGPGGGAMSWFQVRL
eukprot:jgi/Mesvir1/440/Mv11319-RA.1